MRPSEAFQMVLSLTADVTMRAVEGNLESLGERVEPHAIAGHAPSDGGARHPFPKAMLLCAENWFEWSTLLERRGC